MSDLAPDRPDLAPHPLPFPVVGVGASAGGLEAFENFLNAIDPAFPAAYILVQHLDPTHESLLAELLARHTSLAVTQITDGTVVREGGVYIIPSASALQICDGVLSLVEFDAPRGFRRPIDDFFASLAVDQGPNAAAIVLSGTGGDGTVGIRAIKEAAGLTLVQDPDEAAYDGMPTSAIRTGLVDFVTPSREMPAVLRRYFDARDRMEAPSVQERELMLTRVLDAVRAQSGHDFGSYKVNTMTRRVRRRMQVLDLDDADDYVSVLKRSPAEGDALLQDLLINVTSFFRDPEVWAEVAARVVPQIVAQAGPDRPIRVWVPACSSGEEAYTVAILFAEALDALPDEASRDAREVQVFATDIDEEMLARARRGFYMAPALAEVPAHLVARHFTASEDGYEVSKRVRDMVRVSAHSLIKDPPFSRLDLISCRNLLIYFDAALQARVLPLFHYAMRPDGWLLLGSAENIGGRDDLFEAVARKERLYKKVPRSTSNFVLPLMPRGRSVAPRPANDLAREAAGAREDREARIARRMAERYAPPHVIVDRTGCIVHASPRTAPFLQLSVGEPSTRLLDLAPPGLRTALRAMLAAMAERRRRVIRRGVEFRTDGEQLMSVDLIADPLDALEAMIVFREVARRDEDEDDLDADVGDFRTEQRIEELEDELNEMRMRLRTTVEELETSNEELKSSNEEMMSMNEELQSANEELSTVNEELKSKLDELAEANADILNLLESTRIATVFVDAAMRLRSFTPVAKRLFRFNDRDRGRPLTEARSVIDLTGIEDAMARVLAGEDAVTMRIEIEGRAHAFRALPYVDGAGVADGVVLVFDDVSELLDAQRGAVDSEREAAASRREIELLYNHAPIGMALFDSQQRYLRINDFLAAYNGRPASEHIGRTITEVLPEIGPKLHDLVAGVFETKGVVRDHELIAHDPKDPARSEVFELDVYPVPDPEGAIEAAGIVVRRVTEARAMQGELHRMMSELQHRVKNSLATVLAIVGQTVRTTTDRDGLASALTSRIGSLAATHNLLTRADWRPVGLREIVDQELAPYVGDRRVDIAGPPVSCGTKGALTVAMVIHELTTNAVKYGALAGPDGALDVTWAVEGGDLRLTWAERAPGIAAPDSQGFGLRFIDRSLRYDLGGSGQFDWTRGGMTCEVRIPTAKLGADIRDA